MTRSFPAFRLIPVLLAAGCLSVLTAQTVNVDKSSLSFFSLVGGSSPSQILNVTSTGASAFFFVSVADNSSNLKLTLSSGGSTPGPTFGGSTPAVLTVAVDPTGLSAGTYTASLLFNNGIKVAITLTVSNISVFPQSLALSYTVGGALPQPTSISLNGSTTTYTATASTTSGGAWLGLLNGPNGLANSVTGTLPGSVTVLTSSTVLPNLPPGIYNGTITITPTSGAGGPPVTVTVVLTVTAAPKITVSPAALAFNVQLAGASNITSQPVTIGVTPAQSLNFSLSIGTGNNWITLPGGSTGQTDPNTGTATVIIGVNAGTLPVGIYTGQVTVNSALSQTTIKVTLAISNLPLLNVPTAPLNFTYPLGGNPSAPQTVTPTATTGILKYIVADPNNSTWLTVTPALASTPAPFTVAVNTVGLASPGTLTTTLNVTPGAGAGNGAQPVQVNLKVTNDAAIVPSVNSLSFPYQVNKAQPNPVILSFTSSTAATLKFTATAAGSTPACGSQWLQLNGVANGTANGDTTSVNNSFAVSANPAGLAAGTCAGNISVVAANLDNSTVANSPIAIPVTLVVSNVPLLVASPVPLQVFTAQQGAPSPALQNLTVTTTSGTDQVSFKATFQLNNGSGWLPNQTIQGITSQGSNIISVAVNSSQLPIGFYTGSVTVTADDPAVANSPLVIPIYLHITSGALNAGPAALSFSYTVGGSPPPAQTVTLGSNGQPLYYTVSASSNGNWLSVTPGSGITNLNAALSVSVDGSRLTPGSYSGTITVAAPLGGNSPATITVGLTVSPPTISAPTATLTFNQVTGGPAPSPKTIAVTGTPGPVPFTVTSTATQPNGGWLTVTPPSSNTPGTVTVSVSAAGLTPGTYNGSVTITSAGASGSPINIPVVFTVTGATSFTASPASLAFTYTLSLSPPQSQNLQVSSATDGTPFTVTTQVSSGPAGWLVVTPGTGATPAVLAVSIANTGLTGGTFSGTITITSPSTLSPTVVQVTLTAIQIPTPVANAIGNAADYATGAVAPGENIVIFGTGIGPAALARLQVANGVVATVTGNTRVLFDGVPAPVIYASANQTSVMVPYVVGGRASTNIQVEYLGAQSAATSLSVAPTAPAIYSLNQAGTGAGATLNQDGITVNGPATPAPKGSFVAVFMTGEGQTSPAGTDGTVTPSDGTGLKKPTLPVTATVGGVPANVVYAGSAPGLIAGVMQVNLQIPATAPSGAAVPLLISVGTTSTQPGITISVQ